MCTKVNELNEIMIYYIFSIYHIRACRNNTHCTEHMNYMYLCFIVMDMGKTSNQ